MAVVNDNPLTEEHYQKLNDGIDKAASAIAQIERAKAAGLDMSSLEKPAQEVHDKLRRIKQAYFPGR